jgi:uncharacterized membrane protein
MKSQRFWEIDAVRGIAIVCMIFFHTVWDLAAFDRISWNMGSAPWQLFGRSIGFVFLFIFGISATLSSQKNLNSSYLLEKIGKRSVFLGVLAGIISIVTYFVFGREYVRFGILHLLGTSVLLSYFCLALSWQWKIALGLGCISLGNYFLSFAVDYPWLLPFGLMPWGISMVDYYPLLPWFGVVLWGMAGGNLFYPQAKRNFILPDYSNVFPCKIFAFFGRHSLAIYLIHQPLIFLVLVLMGIIPVFDRPI